MFINEEKYLTEEVKKILNKEYKRIDKDFSNKKKAIEKMFNYCISKLEKDRDEEKSCAYNDILLCSYLEIEGEKSVKKFTQNYEQNKTRKTTEIF